MEKIIMNENELHRLVKNIAKEVVRRWRDEQRDEQKAEKGGIADGKIQG